MHPYIQKINKKANYSCLGGIILFLTSLGLSAWGFMSVFASGMSTTGYINTRMLHEGEVFMLFGLLAFVLSLALFIHTFTLKRLVKRLQNNPEFLNQMIELDAASKHP